MRGSSHGGNRPKTEREIRKRKNKTFELEVESEFREFFSPVPRRACRWHCRSAPGATHGSPPAGRGHPTELVTFLRFRGPAAPGASRKISKERGGFDPDSLMSTPCSRGHRASPETKNPRSAQKGTQLGTAVHVASQHTQLTWKNSRII